MLANPVLFQLGSWPCSLAAVCASLGVVLFVVGLGLLILLLVRHGRTRRLEPSEAREAAYQASQLGDLAIHGPATGVESQLTVTIGDLRRAHRAGNRLMFWGMPLVLMTWSSGFALVVAAIAFWTGEAVLFVGYLVLVPMFLIAGFMPWAAVHTDLE